MEKPGEDDQLPISSRQEFNSSASSTDTLRGVRTNDSVPAGCRPACFQSLLQEITFVLICTFAVAQNTLLTGAMRSVTSQIGSDLKMNDAAVTWIIAGQSLASGTFLLFFGRLADLVGRRLMLIISMGTFSIFLLIAGFATTPIFFDAFMGLCGLACAAVVPPAIGKLGAIYHKPSPRKNKAFSCFGAGAPIGVTAGSLISGIVTVITTWRAILWVLAVIYALLTVVAILVTPPDTESKVGGWNWKTLKTFDIVGTLLATAGIALFTAGFTEAGVARQMWRTPYVIALLVAGGVLIIAFVGWLFVAQDPLVPLEPWKDRNFMLLVVVLCLGFYSFNCNIFWLTLSWQNVYHNSALEVAVKFLPAAVGGIVMCIVASIIIHRISNRLMSVIAVVSLAIASALLSATSTKISYWALTFPALVLSVLGQDFQFCVANLYVVSALPKEQRSVGGGIIQTASRIVVAIGLGFQTSIYNSIGGSTSGPSSELYRPYQAQYWASLAGAVLALFFVPFITLGTQGKIAQKEQDAERTQSTIPSDHQMKRDEV